MPKPWIVLDNVIAEPAAVIKEFGDGLADLQEDHAEGETRIVHGRIISDPGISREIENAIQRASELLSITYDDMQPVWLLRYTPGGHYDWHGDNEILDYKERKISVIIALNDEYEGGNTEFIWPRPPHTEIIHLEPGSALVFPAFMFHRALKVTSGERWIIITFGAGEPFK
jgi:predicted 2-oxoglutarate/Fe(II)-dependent dioxygenase YbiX